MKKAFRLLFLSAVVIPFVTITTASAEGPQGYSYHQRNEQNFFANFFRDLFGHQAPHRGGSYSGPSSNPYGGSGATAPIDGGISLLLAAGLGLGVKKAVARNKAAKVNVAEVEA